MIPGRPKGITYRQLAELDFGIFMCAAREGCNRNWGRFSHQHGRVDRAGHIHWIAADRKANRRGMRSFMKLVGMSLHREWWGEPNWRRLYLANVFATRKVQELYHYRVRSEWSMQDKIKAQRFLEKQKVVNLRAKDRGAFNWLLRADLRVIHSLSRRGVRKT